MILLLVDCGLRASEICSIRKSDVSIENRTIKIFGKNSKERLIVFSVFTGKAICKHMNTNTDGEYLFMSNYQEKMNRYNVSAILRYLCAKANIKLISPHQLRHTFAINFLRNGGNVYALQYMLGHYDLSMVKRYLAISSVDIALAQQKASPVMNLKF